MHEENTLNDDDQNYQGDRHIIRNLNPTPETMDPSKLNLPLVELKMKFNNIGNNGNFWSSTENNTNNAWNRNLNYNNSNANRNNNNKENI